MSDVHHSLNCQCCLLLKTSISNSDSLLFYTRLNFDVRNTVLSGQMLYLWTLRWPKDADCVHHHNWHGPTAFSVNHSDSDSDSDCLCVCLSVYLSLCLCLSVSVSLSLSVCLSLSLSSTRPHAHEFPISRHQYKSASAVEAGLLQWLSKQPSQKESDRFTGSVSRIHSPTSSVFAQVSSRRALSQNRFPLCDTPPHPPLTHPATPLSTLPADRLSCPPPHCPFLKIWMNWRHSICSDAHTIRIDVIPAVQTYTRSDTACLWRIYPDKPRTLLSWLKSKKTLSKHIKGSEECCLLGQNTRCEFWVIRFIKLQNDT